MHSAIGGDKQVEGDIQTAAENRSGTVIEETKKIRGKVKVIVDEVSL